MLNTLRIIPLGLGRIHTASSTSYANRRILLQSSLFPRAPFLASARVSQQGLHTSTKRQDAQAAQEAEPASEDAAEGRVPSAPVAKFADLYEQGLVCQTLVRTVTEQMKLDTMTEVQSKTIHLTTQGRDVLGQARTGTGKTLAFLLPVLQNLIKNDPNLERRQGRWWQPPDIRAIIISPTRELAEQIHMEASRLVENTNIILQLGVGGTSKGYHLDKLRREGCHVLIGTPGRLKDLLSDPHSDVRAPNLSALVLDEADRLLDDGFGPEIKLIEKLLPSPRQRDRQTLLFSATFPQEVMSMVNLLMKRDHQFIRTVQPGEQATHARVQQHVVHVHGMENYMPALVELCKREVQRRDRATPFKAIVFFNASALATLAYHTFRALREPPDAHRDRGSPFFAVQLMEMHAKLAQTRRTRTATDFRKAKSAVMFSSDVSARGMDFPNVTHVISVGVPPQRDTYVHRIGRTARVDKPGESWLLLAPLERGEAKSRLSDLPLQKDDSLATARLDLSQDIESANVPPEVATVVNQTRAAAQAQNEGLTDAAYRALIGVLQWVPARQKVVDSMNRLARFGWGMPTPPALPSGLAQKLGFSRCTDLRIENQRKDRWREGREDAPTIGRHGYGRFERNMNDRQGGERRGRERRSAWEGDRRPEGDRRRDGDRRRERMSY